MSEKIETVKVVADTPKGYKTVNKNDLRQSDRIYSEGKSAPAKVRGK